MPVSDTRQTYKNIKNTYFLILCIKCTHLPNEHTHELIKQPIPLLQIPSLVYYKHSASIFPAIISIRVSVDLAFYQIFSLIKLPCTIDVFLHP